MQIFGVIVLVFLALVTSQCLAKTHTEDEKRDVTTFTNEILDWARSGHRTRTLSEIIARLALSDENRRSDFRTFTGDRAVNICTICQSMAKAVIEMVHNGTLLETVKSTVVALCSELNLQTEQVCRGLVDLNAPIIFYIVNADRSINQNDVCGVALQDKSCSTTSERYKWTIQIDQNPPKIITSEETKETRKIVQITDIHYDPLYEPRGNAHCREPTCCRKGQNTTNANTNNKLAGYWGDYNACDSPWHAVVDALTHINDVQTGISSIYFTGDIIDHGVWETTREGNIQSLTKSYNEIKKIFGDTPVYPILGNHEPQPLNAFAPDYIEDKNLSNQWLYELLSNLWISFGWLPESTRQTILKGGFYTVSPRKGFRIIALNNNVCYTYNWWLIYHPNDPNEQLRWLADTLLEAEKNQEYIHILAHIPPGDETCHVTWSKEFKKIINRFAHIITGQFNGHTHFDELNIFYDLQEPKKPINVAWNGGSITPYTKLNPNYKVYTANANTYAIEDVDTWIYNLTAANENPDKRPTWYKSYSFKNEYDLEDLSLSSIHQWVVEMSQNNELLETYRKNYHKHADIAVNEKCDSDCLKNLWCNVATSDASKNPSCEDSIKS